jgi:hypothetical protein
LTATPADQRPRTLPDVIADLERLAAEAEQYPTGPHGYPGKEVADAWSERKSEAIQWAKAVVERIDWPGAEKVSWKRTAANRFPSKDWELQQQHLRRVISELRQWQDEQAVLGPAPLIEEREAPPTPEPVLAESSGAPSRSWMERHGWAAVGALLTLAGLLVAISIGLGWGPFPND